MNLNKRIHWNIGGGFSKTDLLYEFFDKHNLWYKFGSIMTYDGLDDCKWNGGRINYGVKYNKYNHNLWDVCGWGIALTFSSPFIDLEDKIGNSLLSIFHNNRNAIILTSPKLLTHIKTNFPKYKTIFSVTGLGNTQEMPMRDVDLEVYRIILQHHDYIVPRCGTTWSPMLRELPRHRVEIMVNDTCYPNCEYFEDHFRYIARINRDGYSKFTEKKREQVAECWFGLDNMLKTMEVYKKAMGDLCPFDLTTKQISTLCMEGFTRFKISGRDETDDNFISELERFLLPDYEWPQQ